MAEKTKRVFYRRCVRVGNSSGVILPKSLLGSDVRILVIKPPIKIKQDSMKILEPILENILGVYLITKAEKKIELLAISTNINRHMEKGIYNIEVVPLNLLKKSLKEKQDIREKFQKANVIINKKLLDEIRKEIN
jgi:putative transposon-encoded protein